jgi:PAS domain S-box-containing protein
MIDQNDHGTVTDVEQVMFVARQAVRERIRLATAARLAGLGHWEWDLESDTVAASDELCRLHGVDPGDLDGGYATFLAHVHPGDRAQTDSAFRSALAGLGTFEHHHRVVRSDGEVRTLRTRGEVFLDGQARPAHVFGVSWDVTTDLRATQEAEGAARLLRATVESLPEAIVALDDGNRIVAHNRRLHEIWSLSATVAIGTPESALLDELARRLADPWEAGSDHSLLALKDGRVLERAHARADAAAPRVYSFRDVTGRERALAHATLLARASGLLATNDLEPALEAVARAALPLLGELGAVDVVGESGATRLLEVRATPDPWLEPPEQLAAVDRTEVSATGQRSRVTVPIVRHGRRLGVLSFVAAPFRAYGSAEVELAEELAGRIGAAIDDAEARRRAEAEIADREQLLYMAAHELRAPLTSLRLCVEALRRNQAVAALATRQLEVIDRDERRIARLVDDLLDVGRIRSGQLQLELAPMDLCDLVGEIARRMTVEISRSGSPLTCSAGDPVVGRWDRSRLDQVVTNLLVNALKFGQGKPIDVRVTCDGCRARLVVLDQGIGIARELHQRIFEPFERGAADARQYGGLGLGLYIVRTIVERLGGEVRVESERGQGACFTVELPISTSEP